jgi:glyoxylate reductase
MKKRILITEPIVESVIEQLRADFKVDVGQRGQFNDEETLAETIAEYDALLPMLSNPVTKKVIEAGKNLEIIANHAVGYNNIDLDAAHNAHIKVTNTPDVLTESSADFAIGLLLAVARQIPNSQNYLRDGEFNGWEPLGFLGMELRGKTMGILGMGRIGTAVARRAKAFGLNIQYHNRNRVERGTEKELEAQYISSVEELAASSDVLSLHCPLTKETQHLINKQMITRMPGHAILVNTARGPVVDEAALAQALHEGRLGGAGLDVFENEPNIHPRLLDAPRCVLSPHIASATHRSRKAMGQLAAFAISGVLKGKPDTEISNLLPL